MKRIIGAMAATVVVIFAVSTSANAGGWSTISLDQRPETIQADTEFQMTFTVLQHGRHPMNGLNPEITFSHVETGEAHTAGAAATNAEGQYAADLSLPASGEWAWEIEAFGTHEMAPFAVAESPSADAGTANPGWRELASYFLLGTGVLFGFAAVWSAGVGRERLLKNLRLGP